MTSFRPICAALIVVPAALTTQASTQDAINVAGLYSPYDPNDHVLSVSRSAGAVATRDDDVSDMRMSVRPPPGAHRVFSAKA
jgi:hypothetical protein